MAVKKLYTESWIADIADALRTVIGGTDTYNTREMAATLATIHRGAKDVWIGTQFAYNQIPASQIDVEICYIILESGQVIRCYAGSTIIYDTPIVWDCILNNTIVTYGQTVIPKTTDNNPILIAKDTAEEIEADAWEWYLDVDFANSLYSESIALPFNASLVFTPRWEGTSSPPGWGVATARGRSTGIDLSTLPVISPTDDPIPCRFHATKNAGEGIYLYWMNADDSELFLGASSFFDPTGSDKDITFTGLSRSGGDYTIKEFKFRWKT